ncbi:MAG: DNA lyase [Brevinematales bacterium]|nr:DNA lyase [Brevinematales bacterium]
MRLWSLHPKYLDPKGLVALWREALLAQKVLQDQTKGYRYHPQLIRFRNTPYPVATICAYLEVIADEAAQRGYRFERSKISITPDDTSLIAVTDQQLKYEAAHLRNKLITRAPGWSNTLPEMPEAHPLFLVIKGAIEAWERGFKKN